MTYSGCPRTSILTVRRYKYGTRRRLEPSDRQSPGQTSGFAAVRKSDLPAPESLRSMSLTSSWPLSRGPTHLRILRFSSKYQLQTRDGRRCEAIDQLAAGADGDCLVPGFQGVRVGEAVVRVDVACRQNPGLRGGDA